MIPLFKIHHPVGVGDAIERTFASGIIAEGAACDEFEKQLGALFESSYVALTNSATSALTLAYRACDVGPGTEVISSPVTCAATNQPIVNAGASIVWADVQPDTGNIDPSCVEKLITDRTRAIVAVHWAGQPFDIDELCEIGRRRGVPIIADAAHALGATYKNKSITQNCDHTIFSFQAIKHLTTGDGGAIVSRAKLDHERIKLLRWFGIDRKFVGPRWEQDIIECGYKFHMNDIAATIGLSQLDHIPSILFRHGIHGSYFDRVIDDSARVKKLRRPDDRVSAHWIYTLLVDDPDEFKAFMKARGIATDRVHMRNDRYTAFKAFRRDSDLPGVDEFCAHMINIPVGWWLSPDDTKKIAAAVNEYGI